MYAYAHIFRQCHFFPTKPQRRKVNFVDERLPCENMLDVLPSPQCSVVDYIILFIMLADACGVHEVQEAGLVFIHKILGRGGKV